MKKFSDEVSEAVKRIADYFEISTRDLVTSDKSTAELARARIALCEHLKKDFKFTNVEIGDWLGWSRQRVFNTLYNSKRRSKSLKLLRNKEGEKK